MACSSLMLRSSCVRSCLMTKVSSLISTGRSSKSVLRRASCVRRSSLAMVPVMPRPISAARRANSERCAGVCGRFAADSSDCRWLVGADLRRWLASRRMARNSGVRSWMGCAGGMVSIGMAESDRTGEGDGV